MKKRYLAPFAINGMILNSYNLSMEIPSVEVFASLYPSLKVCGIFFRLISENKLDFYPCNAIVERNSAEFRAPSATVERNSAEFRVPSATVASPF